ncbi:MAG: CAP domain-containing protein [Propionibacteriales bacterium]|nr:CAP domain-containing protein [Propionibacteriales bacterium]
MMSVMRTLASVCAAVSLLVVALVAAPATTANAARPSGKSVSVHTVAVEGGTVVTITGKNLKKVNAVYFGGTKVTTITHLSKTKLRVKAPRHTPGTVKISLRVGTKKYTTALKVTFVITQPEPSAAEAEVLRLTNLNRTAGYTCTDSKTGDRTVMPPVPALTWNANLATAARLHSVDMAKKNYFSHNSTDGTDPGTRITRAGYDWWTYGENIAAGYSTPANVVAGWMSSYGHCKNIMDADFTELGVGYAYNSASKYDHYWTQDFGAPR